MGPSGTLDKTTWLLTTKFTADSFPIQGLLEGVQTISTLHHEFVRKHGAVGALQDIVRKGR